MKRATTVPPAVRAVMLTALRPESDHAAALPDPLPLGRVLNLFDKSRGNRERTRIRADQDERGFFLDYYRVENDGTTSWHGRVREDGTLEDLENYEGQFGTRAFPDPADTQRERERVGLHNAHVRDLLQAKGFL